MRSVQDKTGPIHRRVVAFALSIALGSVAASCSTNRSATDQNGSGATHFRRMPDGKQWTTDNLSVNSDPSYCYDDAELNCRRRGRLYTWESAQRACQSLGDGWQLPTNDEWRQLTKHFGGVRDDSDDSGSAAYKALLFGGSSGFDALLGGGRSNDGQYARLNAHGFYWTSSESDSATAWFYNFGEGGRSLNRHKDGEKQMAVSVRCVRR
jgi:uncharacterized protein (TIGR02145 family)